MSLGHCAYLAPKQREIDLTKATCADHLCSLSIIAFGSSHAVWWYLQADRQITKFCNILSLDCSLVPAPTNIQLEAISSLPRLESLVIMERPLRPSLGDEELRLGTTITKLARLCFIYAGWGYLGTTKLSPCKHNRQLDWIRSRQFWFSKHASPVASHFLAWWHIVWIQVVRMIFS